MSTKSSTVERVRFPAGGETWEEIQSAMDKLIADDVDWRAGRSPLYVFRATEEAYEIGKRGFMKFFSENALGGKRVFLGLKKMEDDLVCFGLDLFNAPQAAAGIVSTGGSESIVIAVRAAREFARSRKSNDKSFNIVVPVTAHPAFNKACDLMDIELRFAGLRQDRRADVDEMESLVDDQTIMLLGSAPCFPHGVVDPIDKLSALAEKLDIWLHVDACVGGYIIPFLRRTGRNVPEFDFTHPGVSSISADLHKFGFCPKPISTLFFKNVEDQSRAKFVCDTWPSGRFETNTVSGTRAGGAIAGAWGVLNHLGISGFSQIAEQLGLMVDKYVEGIESIEGLHMIARPDATIINFTADDIDIFSVAELLTERGWTPGLTRSPKGLHAMMSMFHDPAREQYLADLATAVTQVRSSNSGSSNLKATY